MKRTVLVMILFGALFLLAAPAAEARHAYDCPATGVDLADAAWCGVNCTWDAFTGGQVKRFRECFGL